MECAPLNLAHFHERRAERHLKRYRYDEAIKAMETALAYIEDAYKTISIPKAVQVLDAEKWDCSRKLKQINIRKAQHDGLKITSLPVLTEPHDRHDDPPEHISRTIDQAIENFDAKFASSTIDNNGTPQNNSTYEGDSTNWLEELESKDMPTLAPLELPSFDLGIDNSPVYEEHDK